MGKQYRCEIVVRGYEVDSFGHVYNAVYLSYLDHARRMMLEQEGMTIKMMVDLKRWPVVASLEMQFVRPTFEGDSLVVQTQITEHSRTNFFCEQSIFRGETPVLKAKSRIVTINEAGRPAEMPDGVTKTWTE